MAKNKIVINGEVQIDLTGDNVTAANVDKDVIFHLPDGTVGTGTSTKDADTSDATLLDAEAASGKTFYKDGQKRTGSAPVRGGVTGTISTKAQEYTIPLGLHDGSGKVSIAATEQAKIIPSNIKAGVEILGETGEYTGEGVTAQSKNVTPTFSQQTVIPDSNYDYLSQVVVAPIPVTETPNSAGGTTVTVG